MLGSLGENLTNTMKKLVGMSVIDKKTIKEVVKEIQRALIQSDVNIALVKREFVRRANEVVLLCDSSKFGKCAFMKFADAAEIDLIITDEYADEKILNQYRNHGINVEIASIQNDN